MKYLAKTKTRVVTQNEIITPEDFGGWSALNTGDTLAYVNDVPLDATGSVVGVDFTAVHPSVIWGEDIIIRFDTVNPGTTPRVVLTFIKYTEI